MLLRYFLYLVRWQLSTPILSFCIVYFAKFGSSGSSAIANLIGGLIFFWVDRFIFSGKIEEPIWAVRENVVCADCGKISRGYRLIKARNYDKEADPCPKFRCEECSTSKTNTLRDEGVELG